MKKRMSKILSVVLTCLMVCTSIAIPVSAAEPTLPGQKIVLTSPTGTIKAGDEIKLEMGINNPSNLAGVQYKLKWNPEYLSIDTGMQFGKYKCYVAPGDPNIFTKTYDINLNNAANGTIVIGGLAGFSFEDYTDPISLGTLKLTVLPAAAGQTVKIEVVESESYAISEIAGVTKTEYLDVSDNASFTVEGAAVTKHIVTFKNEDAVVKSFEVEDGKAIGAEMPADPTKEGYTFDGWYDGETKITAETTVTGNITATAKFTAIPATKYTVTFKNEDTVVKSVDIEDGKAIGAENMPADPTKDGHTFDGWFDGETKITSETVVTGNITATAKFTKNSTGGVTLPGQKIVLTSPTGTIKAGDEIKLEMGINNPSNLAGVQYKLKWNPEYLSIDTGMQFGKYKCYVAPGDPNIFTKTYDINLNNAANGTIVIGGLAGFSFEDYTDPISLGTLKLTVLPAAAGQTVKIEVVESESYAISEIAGVTKTEYLDVSDNASFTVEGAAVTQYTVKFNDGTTDVKTVQIDENAAIGAENMPADPTKEGYTFDGWFDGETKITAETVVTGNIAATAKFTLIPPTQYAVTFKDGETTVDTVMVNKGETVTAEKMPKAPEKTGYTFKGWFIGEDEFTGDTVVNDNITVTAVYEINKYTVTFKDGENELGKADVDYNTAIGAANMPADPTKEGYTFDGWYDGETKITAETVVTGNITATAKFDVKSYQVTFDIDGTTEKVVTINYGDKIGDEMPADPVKEGYVFKGWFNGEEEITKDTEVKGSFTATAKFEEKVPENFTVTFVSDGKTVYMADILEGTTIGDANIPNDRVKDGYTFKGWFNGDDEVKADTTVTGSITVEAKFEVTPAEEIFSLGDADGSGEINGADIVLFRQKLLRRPVMVFDSSKDLYKDGEFDGNDVIRLAQYYAGLLDDSNIQITPAP